MTILKFKGSVLNGCQITYVLMMFFLLTTILARWWTPQSSHLNKKSHTILWAMYLAASADYFDLIEYGYDPNIAEVIGVDLIYGKYECRIKQMTSIQFV